MSQACDVLRLDTATTELPVPSLTDSHIGLSLMADMLLTCWNTDNTMSDYLCFFDFIPLLTISTNAFPPSISIIALLSTLTGYRHVYLEGMTEASIFVHITVHDIYGKVSSWWHRHDRHLPYSHTTAFSLNGKCFRFKFDPLLLYITFAERMSCWFLKRHFKGTGASIR